MLRAGLIALVTGVVVTSGVANAKPDKKAKVETKADKGKAKADKGKADKGKKSAKASGTSRKDGKGSSARITAKRNRGVSARTRMDNMPAGFTWPPTPRMLEAEKACQAKLDVAGVAWTSAPSDGRMVAALTVDDMTFGGVAYRNVWGSKGPHKLDCQLAFALETVGTELYALGVREVRFGSLYRWSNIRAFGKTLNQLSRHALGLAMDIASFVDADGRVVNVKAEYPRHDALLLAIESTINASKRFRILLTPKNDPVSHSDHFHFEAVSNFTATLD